MNFDPPLQTVAFDQSLIYMWEIRDQSGTLLGRYVGKAKEGAKRPLTHYKRNVENILTGKPYRKSNPEGYRSIHVALAEAHRHGHRITLSFLCNVQATENINEAERQWIVKQNSQGTEAWQLNG
jgi:hypothetical protein